jgi:hypothetical protein
MEGKNNCKAGATPIFCEVEWVPQTSQEIGGKQPLRHLDVG